ncbi:MAG: SOS cell division inhibitor SulA, partial [Gammaproteobacteria bacterium]|nr:SOS cell division inhibitor SulA [Gammaproteobacteria bacterium]
LCAASGIGELRLLAPALKGLSESENRWIVWINPPHVPYAPALERLGVDLGKVLLVFPKDHREALWAFEQTLATASCCAALGWLSESRLRFADIRRLQLAARKGGAWATLFRPASAAGHASPAELRIEATSLPSPPASRLRLDIRKRRSGWPVEGIEVELDAPLGRREAGRLSLVPVAESA